MEENEISVNSNGGTEQVKRMIGSMLPEGLLDDFQVICSRVRKIDDSKIRVYWIHDCAGDPETSHNKDKSSRDRFHKIVFCGNWQYNQYLTQLNLEPEEKFAVIDTPIIPFEDYTNYKGNNEEIRLIYTSTPQRGLTILVPVFIELAKKYPKIGRAHV